MIGTISVLMFSIISTVSQGFAFEWLPEYSSLTPEEEAKFDGPVELSQEYQSDLLAYLKPQIWEIDWLTHDIAMDLSVGSISAAHFVMDTRAKIKTDLLKGAFEFKFIYFDERNRERESQHAIVDLSAWPLQWLGVHFYGEPSLYKRDDDVGLALTLRPVTHLELRLFHTWVDVTRAKRNDQKDTHLEPYYPYSRGAVARFVSNSKKNENDFIEIAFRDESETHWLFPTRGYEYSYQNRFASIFGSKFINDRLRTTLRIQWNKKFESKTPSTDSSTVVAEQWTTQRTFALFEVSFMKLGPWETFTLRPGIELAVRSWETTFGDASTFDTLPHLWFEFPGFATRENRSDRWKLGADTVFHRLKGPKNLLEPNDRDKAIEARFNLAYDFSLGQKASLTLMATADLDEFGTKRTWEGGNAQFRLYF